MPTISPAQGAGVVRAHGECEAAGKGEEVHVFQLRLYSLPLST